MVDVDGVDSDGEDGGADAVNAAVSAQTMEIQRIWRLQFKAKRSTLRWNGRRRGLSSEMKGVYAATKKASRRRMDCGLWTVNRNRNWRRRHRMHLREWPPPRSGVVWRQYTDWVKDRGLKLEAVALCSRSVRNHPQPQSV